MKKMLFIGLFFIIGCTSHTYSRGYYYVANTETGYVVNLDSCCGPSTVTVTHPMYIQDAENLCNTLNKDMNGNRHEENKGF